MIADCEEFNIEVFIPEVYVDALREALHQAGAGRVGNYDHCASIMDVRGYWRPLDGSQPWDGKPGEISQGRECKVESRCKKADVAAVIEAIHHVHPYEEPFISVIPIANHLFPDPRKSKKSETEKRHI